MFEWYKKKRLNEHVKFFGGTQKKFISCYAKQVKPRIRGKIKDSYRINLHPSPYVINPFLGLESSQAQSLANMQHQNGSLFSAANIAAQQQIIGMQNANNLMQQGNDAARGMLAGTGGFGAAAGIFRGGYRGY